MARIRTIKPDFFRNHKLYLAETEEKLPLRLSFAGLWTSCDRDGRFKWVPEELKLDCLPFDNVDFSRVLDALWSRGYILKYKSENDFFGFVPSWIEHQHINNRESESLLPNPYESDILTCEGRVEDTSDKLPRGKERKGKEGERKSKEFIPPTIEEVKTYFKENKYKEEAAIKMFNSYSVANWIDSKGNPVKNWKQKAINVWFTDQNKDLTIPKPSIQAPTQQQLMEKYS